MTPVPLKSFLSTSAFLFALFLRVGAQTKINASFEQPNRVTSFHQYAHEIKEDSMNALVALSTRVPHVKLDLRYAGTNNFMHEKLYCCAKALLRLPAAMALQEVAVHLYPLGLGLIVYDAYRPYSVTVVMFDKVKDSTYAASPKNGSRHNRGCAIDVSLYDLKTGKPLAMPTEFDDFSEKAHADYPGLPTEIRNNRQLLRDRMMQFGFLPLRGEWWHFDFKDWKKYSLLDLPLSVL